MMINAVCLLGFCFFIQLDEPTDLELVDQASVNFAVRHHSIDRYLVVAEGFTDCSENENQVVGDFEYFYAFSDDGNDPSRVRERVENSSIVLSTSGGTYPREVRQLKSDGKYWMNSGADIFDVLKLPLDVPRPTPPVVWDPFTLPVSFWSTLRLPFPDYRNLESYVMTPGRLFSASVSEKHLTGRWKLGKPKEYGFCEITFDRNQENVPIRMRVYSYKPGVDSVNDKTFQRNSVLSCEAVSQWKKLKSGALVPEIVECVEMTDRRSPSSWKVKMQWWVEDEVPKEVFTAEDFARSHVRDSVIHRLTNAQVEQYKKNSGR